jgi:hypothetical protein
VVSVQGCKIVTVLIDGLTEAEPFGFTDEVTELVIGRENLVY